MSSFDQNPECQLEYVQVGRLLIDEALGKDTQHPQLGGRPHRAMEHGLPSLGSVRCAGHWKRGRHGRSLPNALAAFRTDSERLRRPWPKSGFRRWPRLTGCKIGVTRFTHRPAMLKPPPLNLS